MKIDKDEIIVLCVCYIFFLMGAGFILEVMKSFESVASDSALRALISENVTAKIAYLSPGIVLSCLGVFCAALTLFSPKPKEKKTERDWFGSAIIAVIVISLALGTLNSLTNLPLPQECDFNGTCEVITTGERDRVIDLNELDYSVVPVDSRTLFIEYREVLSEVFN